MSDLTYKIHHLSPTDPNLPYLAGKFASLRLSALSVSPTSFASTFALESSFPPATWLARLTRPNVHYFIAIAYPSTCPASQQTITTGDFVGSATLLGPVPKATYELPLSHGPVIGEDEMEMKWQMTAVFNSPSHRGKGVAKMLVKFAWDFAADYGKGGGRGVESRMRIMIHPKNKVVRRLYEGLGFVDAGNCTYVEAVWQNGDGELLPAGGESELEHLERMGIVMEKVG